ncbi:MAG TPA: NERD domain-containing protein [Clostridia bacterium]|nr:NERD domain-containing protein [Clostridia bacterium]
MQKLPEEPLASINAKIEYYQQELEELKNQKEFPYLYIMVALPVTAVFLLLAVISDGLVDFTAAITGALFFSLLITCAYLVLYQPNREELENQIQRQLATLYREKSKLEAGLKGEREVAYILSWLPKEFITINNVYLAAGDLEVQQFDHIVVGPPGVIHLETKTINGAVLIDPKGNWTVLKASQNKIIREGMDSPLPQMQRHEMILQNFLQQEFPGENIPIYGIVVMGNSRTIVEGEDPRLTVLKRDKLNEYIKSLPAPAPLSQDLINKIALALIEHHRDLS